MLQQERKLVTYNNIGNAKREIMTSASTLGELQLEFDRAGIAYQGMKIIDGKTQHSYESRGAVLPESDFVLFMVPERVKSGLAA
jgi:hypothetical protein